MGDVAVTVDEVVTFVRSIGVGVVATLGPDGRPEAALVGIAATDGCELVFDAAVESRKVANLARDPRVAVVVGGAMDDERTLQCEGVADRPAGDEDEAVCEAYFAQYPDGRARWNRADITHYRVRVAWLRYSDYTTAPPVILEASAGADGRLRFGPGAGAA